MVSSAPESSVDDDIAAENFHTPPDEVTVQSQSSDEANPATVYRDAESRDNHLSTVASSRHDFVDSLRFQTNPQDAARVLEFDIFDSVSSKKYKPASSCLGFKSPGGEVRKGNSNRYCSYLGLKCSDSHSGDVKSKLSSTYLGLKSPCPLAGDAQRVSTSNVINSFEKLENPNDTATVDRNGNDAACVNSLLDEDGRRMSVDILVAAALQLEGSDNMHRMRMNREVEAEKASVERDEGGLGNSREGNDVSVKENVDGRQLPFSFRGHECDVESEFSRRWIAPQISWVNSIHKILNLLSRGGERKMIDGNVVDAAMNRGVRFPRPRWWSRDGYGKEVKNGILLKSNMPIEDSLKTDAEENYNFDTHFVPLDTNDSLLQDC